jgi:hypothetical protein
MARRETLNHPMHREGDTMSRDVAQKVLDLLVRHCAKQEAMVAEIRAQCTEDEFKRYRLMIAHSVGSMYLDVMAPIIGKYPGLKPLGLKGPP